MDHKLNARRQWRAAEKKANATLRCLNRSRVCKTHKAKLALCWVPGRPHPGHCALLQAPRFSKGMAQLERVQRSGGRTITGLKTMTCEERLNTVGLFALKRSLRGDMITVFQRIKGCSKEEGNNLFSMTKRTRKSWQLRRFESNIRQSLSNCKNSEALQDTGKNRVEFSWQRCRRRCLSREGYAKWPFSNPFHLDVLRQKEEVLKESHSCCHGDQWAWPAPGSARLCSARPWPLWLLLEQSGRSYADVSATECHWLCGTPVTNSISFLLTLYSRDHSVPELGDFRSQHGLRQVQPVARSVAVRGPWRMGSEVGDGLSHPSSSGNLQPVSSAYLMHKNVQKYLLFLIFSSSLSSSFG